MPHDRITSQQRQIVEGDTVIIDVGALVDGYHSDMTRSYVIGEPTASNASCTSWSRRRNGRASPPSPMPSTPARRAPA